MWRLGCITRGWRLAARAIFTRTPQEKGPREVIAESGESESSFKRHWSNPEGNKKRMTQYSRYFLTSLTNQRSVTSRSRAGDITGMRTGICLSCRSSSTQQKNTQGECNCKQMSNPAQKDLTLTDNPPFKANNEPVLKQVVSTRAPTTQSATTTKIFSPIPSRPPSPTSALPVSPTKATTNKKRATSNKRRTHSQQPTTKQQQNSIQPATTSKNQLLTTTNNQQ